MNSTDTATKTNSTKNLKHFSFSINRDNVSKTKGSNRLVITRQVPDVYIQDQTVSMSIQEAKALKTFLEKHLD